MLEKWRQEGTYRFEPGAENFVIDTPPPYPSGRPWHVGAAAHYAQIDMIARAARMSGKNVYFPVGIDRNGLPVELYTEKKHGIRMQETERGRFLDLCREALDDLESEMILIMRNLGLSGDLDGHYRTDSEKYRALTQATFIKLWKDGRVYLATRPTNYDWVSGTTIADAEISYADLPSKLVYMKFEHGNEHLTVASTRPELLCACRAVIVHPDDERYSDLHGREVRVPLAGRKVPVRPHSSARQDFGSGAVMICSYGDQHDVALFRELGLDEIAAISTDGRMTEAAGKYAGLRPKKARESVISDLQEAGLAEKIEQITHRTPVSERTKNPVEIIPLEEYYVKQTDRTAALREASDQIKFHPERHRQILHNWLDSVAIDWPASRRRYYGTEIPVWYCSACGEPHVPEPGKYRQPWREECPAQSCSKCGGTEFRGEQRTFDTWMDSSVSPLFISRYGEDDEFFKATYPASVRPQAKDIVRTWLYYTLLRCTDLDGRVPWSDAWIMGYGLDERGLKMSKSRGNAIDPLPLIEKVGADTFRFWSAGEIGHGSDFRCNEQKIEATGKFLSKLWNVARLVSGFERRGPGRPSGSDEWILGELDALVRECRSGYSDYNFFVPAVAIREFVWNIFAAHYLEMSKKRAYGDGFSEDERDAAIHTMHRVLSTVLLLLAPIAPFITEHLWQQLYSDGKSVHLEAMPSPEGPERDPEKTAKITEFNSSVWNAKKSRGLSLKDSVSTEIPSELSELAADLRAMHNLS